MKVLSVQRLIPARAFGLLLLALALAMVLAVAACESEDDPTATPESADTSSTTEQTDTSQTGSSGDTQMDHEPLQVIATSNIVGDWVKNIGGDRVEVTSLIPPGGDPHTYQPGARDVAQIVDSDLVFTVGLQLEGQWLEELIHNASTDESKIIALAEGVNPIEYSETGAHHDEHDDHDDHMDEMGHGDLTGRLLVADGVEAHLSVIDLSTDDVDSGIFDIAGPNARIYPSLNHRYGFVLARGPESGDDRIHIFDGGVYLEEHGDHFDLITDPVSRHPLEIVEEWPVHAVNSNGWTSIFADTNGHALLFDEEGLARSGGDYEPTVFDAGVQHGTGFAITDEHVVMSVGNPLCPVFIPGTWDCLPLGAIVSDLDGNVVYDAASDSCTFLHGEAYNEHGAFFGCQEGILFIHEHDGQFEHEVLPYPAELGEPEMSAIIVYYWHHDSDNFFGIGNRRGVGQAGIWLVDPVNREIREIFPDPSAAFVFSNDGETFYILADDGILRAFDSHDGELIESVQVLEPFERMFGSPSPAMIVVGEWLFLSDPYSGRVLGVHLEHMEIEEEWELGGAPASLAFVGLGVDDHHEDEHAHEDEHDHDEDDDHDDHEDEDDHDDHDHHDHGTHDPHFWFDPVRVQTAVIEIATRLATLDPAGAETYTANATAYVAQLQELHAWSEQQLATIPADHRILVTSHDTHSYFALLYGFEVVGTVIPSGTTETESSAEQLAHLVEIIEHEGVPAVFGENTVPERIARAIADETGAGFFSLFTGSLGPAGSGAETYLTMFRKNIEIIVEALS